MEEVCERENRREAMKRVRANQGSPGIDGMTVDELPEYLGQHWPAIREQLLSGTYEPKPVSGWRSRSRMGGAQAGHPDSAGPVCPAGGTAGSTEAVGPDVFRTQLRFSTGAVGPTRRWHRRAVYRRRRLRLACVDFDLEKFFDRSQPRQTRWERSPKG